MPVGVVHQPGDPDESGLYAVSRSWTRQRGGPDELLAVANADAAFEVSFELVAVMG